VLRIRTVQRILWGLNALLAMALLAFAGRFLVASPRIDRLSDLDRSAAAPSPTHPGMESPSEKALLGLRNPLRKSVGPTPPPIDLILKGALPASQPANGTAFIRSKAGASETIARIGESIHWSGKAAAEYSEWLLSDLGKDYAVFSNRHGERYVLEIESLRRSEGNVDRRPPSRLGEAYRPEIYQSRRLACTESREVWGIDENELDWAVQNSRQLLDRDVQISFSNGGALRIDALSPDSMPSARGLKPGDILREVNGRAPSSLADLQATLSNPPKLGLQLTLERAGRPFVIEYRPLPR
jgi:hypothetical protein